MSTAGNEPHIVALHQALIPNWTSPAFNKFVDATRGLVDELANSNAARDGREEMIRCEEIFKQICWIEERFWPDVDGMGEVDESARLGTSGMGPMGANVSGMENTMTNALNNGMNNNMNTSAMNPPGPMNGPGMNGPSVNNQVTNSNIPSQGINGSNMNQALNGPGINQTMNASNLNGGDTTPSESRTSYGTLDGLDKAD